MNAVEAARAELPEQERKDLRFMRVKDGQAEPVTAQQAADMARNLPEIRIKPAARASEARKASFIDALQTPSGSMTQPFPPAATPAIPLTQLDRQAKITNVSVYMKLKVLV